MKQLFYVACLSVAGLFSSCSKDNDSLAISNATDKTVTTTSNENSAGNTVRITSSGFTPAELYVVAGNDVVWINDDQAVHTVTANDGSFKSNDIAPGASFTFRFQMIADHNYHCDYHPGEKGLIDVKGIR
jgi:plastocyanin